MGERQVVVPAIAALIDLHLLFATKAKALVSATALGVVRIDSQRLVMAKRAPNEVAMMSVEKGSKQVAQPKFSSSEVSVGKTSLGSSEWLEQNVHVHR